MSPLKHILRRHCQDFFIAYELTQIVDKPTRIPNIAGYHAKFLDLTLSHLLSRRMLRFDISDHSLINVKFNAKPKASSDILFHMRIFRYAKAECDNFRTLLRLFFQCSSKVDSLKKPLSSSKRFFFYRKFYNA